MVKSKHSAYAPRNVLNAPEIKNAIQLRSEKRQDSDEIKAWLLNHFFRHIVANFVSSPPEMLEIKTLEQAKNYVKNFGICELTENDRYFLSNGATKEEVDEFLVKKYKIQI